MRSVLPKFVAVVVTIATSSSVLATQSSLAAGPDDEVDDMPGMLTPQEGPLATGKVVAIDRNARQIEIEHPPIEEFYMQRMTMIFKVADPSLLYGLTPGDKIRFRLERDGRSYVITRIENSN